MRQAAKGDFEDAQRRGFWRAIWSWLSNRENSLLAYDEVIRRLDMRGQSYLGLKTIPLDQIVGSVGRVQDFDRAFFPIQSRTRDRWMNIDQARLTDVPLPPIEVYQVGEVYFVRDGNHRVSVARERGQTYIDAVVIETRVDVPVTTDTRVEDLMPAQERANFLRRSGLMEMYPEADLTVTTPGGYERLLEHIEVHRWFMGEARGAEVPYAEAVASWYEQVYRPLAAVIQERDVLRDFPGRTVADLYLYIVDHLHYLRQSAREDVSLEEAVEDYAGRFAETNPGLLDLIQLAAQFFGAPRP